MTSRLALLLALALTLGSLALPGALAQSPPPTFIGCTWGSGALGATCVVEAVGRTQAWLLCYAQGTNHWVNCTFGFTSTTTSEVWAAYYAAGAAACAVLPPSPYYCR